MIQFNANYQQRIVVKALKYNQDQIIIEIEKINCDDLVLTSLENNLIYLESDGITLMEALSFIYFQGKIFVYESKELQDKNKISYGVLRDLPARIKNITEKEFESLVFLPS